MVQQKPFLLFNWNSGLLSHARPALTNVLLFLQPIEELRETVLNILKDADQKLEGNLSVKGLTGAWACGGSLVLPARKQGALLSVPAPHILRSVVKVWNPDLKNETLLLCLG